MSEMSERERAAAERLRRAERAESRLKNDVREKRDAARAVIDEQLRAEYDEPLRIAAQERCAAQKALDDVRISEQASTGPAIGKRYIEIARRSTWGEERGPTGRVSVVEQRTHTTMFRENARWGLPMMGDKFLRVLKKDGTPSLNFARIGDWDWKPEGDK
jgi:hypothetical protein